MLNNCLLTGNLGADPEVFYSSEGDPIATFNLAFRSSKKKTNWIKITCFNKLAEITEKYLHRGARIALIGTLDQQKWETDEGFQRSSFQLIANSIEFIKTDGRGFEDDQGMVSKTELSASYRHVSTKILNEFPVILDKVSVELGRQRHQIGLSMESPVDDPMKTIESFNRQFGLNEDERNAVEWAWPQEAGDTMFAVVNSYTRAAQFSGLSAELSYKLQRVGGNVLGMLS